AEDRLAEGHAATTPVAGRIAEVRRSREGAGEQAVTERAVAHDADTVGEAPRERLVLLAPIEHVVAHLRDVDPAGAQAFGHHRAGEVGHTDEADASGGDDFLQRAPRLLDRRVAVRPVPERR